MIELAVHAEELGYYSVTIPHVPILPYGSERPPDGFIWKSIPTEYKDYQYDALVLLPMIAQATSRIKIGFNVAVTPWLHPFVWAKYLASLDAATQGRVIAGFGLGAAIAGQPAKAPHNIGIEGKHGKMSDEVLDVIMRLWHEDEPQSFDGEFYKGHDLVVEPKPVQKPHPEFWWAGAAKAGARRAAQHGGMLELTWPSLRRIREELAPNHVAERPVTALFRLAGRGSRPHGRRQARALRRGSRAISRCGHRTFRARFPPPWARPHKHRS
jgi:alkanesulfonate monooxygenase SsuD/methylene tetrahydromethanopterin reductase-like flavin-dependent oxidoreductase (luciferase family)